MNAFVDRMLDEYTHDELRTFTVPELEARLNAAEREVLGTRHVQFTVDAPVVVSVVRDVAKLVHDPTWFWLEDLGFALTELRVDVIGRRQEVWEAHFDAGRIGLGVNGLEDADLHYFVVVRPQTPGIDVTIIYVEPAELTVTRLTAGISPYVDRDHPVTLVPDQLAGQLLLRTDVDPTKSAFRFDGLFPFLPGPQRSCAEVAEPQRWVDAGQPDAGRSDALVSAHRGAPWLAPENTMASYEYAFAYGVDLVEVDVQQTKDGQLVALHDDTVDRTTNGSGRVNQLTLAQIRALNAADYEPWRGSAYDPSQVATLEEVMTLAARIGAGIELDIKGSVTDEDRLADLVAAYGLLETSIFNTRDPRVLAVQPAARLIYNTRGLETPKLLWHLTRHYAVFGSNLAQYTAEKVAAIHDGCAVVMPHAYDRGPEHEGEEFLAARALGADGVQTNQPNLVVDLLDEPVRTSFRAPGASHRAGPCLVNRDRGLGLPGKLVTARWQGRSFQLLTGRGGCVTPPGARAATVLHWPGDGTAQPAHGAAPAPSP